MNIDERIGLLMSAWRKRSGLSQDALAQLVGLQQTAISKIEAGKQTLTVEQLLSITDVCGISLQEALGCLYELKNTDPKPIWERIDE